MAKRKKVKLPVFHVRIERDDIADVIRLMNADDLMDLFADVYVEMMARADIEVDHRLVNLMEGTDEW